VPQTFRTVNVITPDKLHLRAGIWDLPKGTAAKAVCVLLSGMTEFLEKYGEVAEDLNSRGFVVVGLDWRSQGASERSRAGNRASHVATFDAYDRDLAALLLQVVEPILRATPMPVIALAHSMGAHILLRFLHEHPRRIACAVMLAPMIEIDTGTYSPQMAQALAFAVNLRRPSERMVLGADRDPLEIPFEDNVYTSDRARFERTKALLNRQRFLRVYGATFGWLGAAFSSIARIKRRGFAEDIQTPVLIFGAGKDRVVKTPAIRDYAKRMPKARYVEIAEAEHEILMENDAIRARFWAEFDAFVTEQLANAVPFVPRPSKPVAVKPIRGFGGKNA
jgi:lysophospholipase